MTATRTLIFSLTVSIVEDLAQDQCSVLSPDAFQCVCSRFAASRAQQGEVVRNACRIVPLEAFQIATEWLQYQVTSPIDPGDTTCKCLCSVLACCQGIRQTATDEWGGLYMEYMVDFFNLT